VPSYPHYVAAAWPESLAVEAAIIASCDRDPVIVSKEHIGFVTGVDDREELENWRPEITIIGVYPNREQADAALKEWFSQRAKRKE
jgi:hypothetical protein